ncbi:MAG: energy transducer TonB [Acidobacteria bacterium]|nr:energy transducer TonB [Acidobacteriota bacterium]
MYFDFDDRHPDYEGIPGRTWRDGLFVPWWLVVSIAYHVMLILSVVFVPSLFPVAKPTTSELEAQMAAMRDREGEARRFVFVQPRAEFEAKQPPKAPELSDRDRTAMTPFQPPPNPANDLPFSRGNTPERIDQPGSTAPPPDQRQADSGSGSKDPGSPAPGPPGPQQQAADDAVLRGLTGPAPMPRSGAGGTGTGGGLSEALRDVTKYVPQQIFDNPQGGGQFGSAIQFDTKGVEFGPWVRRFIAQIKRNWFVPYAAMSLRGHVVVTFNVHKDGSITDVSVIGPCPIDAFNNSSFNAIAASNPTQPLPPEYPSDHAVFTVTFFYNETPPSR